MFSRIVRISVQVMIYSGKSANVSQDITRGKADLSKTGGPVKSPRKDELKESLLAKKQDWQKAKEEGRELPGQVHNRKISGATPVTPPKPEALAKRDLLARLDGDRATGSPAKVKRTPEVKPKTVLPAQKPLLQTVPVEKTDITDVAQTKLEPLSKQASAPAELEHQSSSGTSVLAARFNPSLAGILARGPPTAAGGAKASSSARSIAPPERSSTMPSASMANESSSVETLEDMRKGRARGPKKRKQTGANAESAAIDPETVANPITQPQLEAEASTKAPGPILTPKLRAPPGSVASLMASSLPSTPKLLPSEPEKPATLARTPNVPVKSLGLLSTQLSAATPEIGGFNRRKNPMQSSQIDDDKENADSNAPSTKAAASLWGRQHSPRRTGTPPQIQLPSKRDEEAAMRSAGLLATSTNQPTSKNGLGISVEKSRAPVLTPPGSAGLPPRPIRSSRSVSGLLQEASANKGA